MITEIGISNFRSIKEQTIPIKKLNILYGPNGSGKSSVAYAPYVMRNLLVNPNQKPNSLFNLGFIDLGSYENVIKDNHFLKNIGISITSELSTIKNNPDHILKYTLNLQDFLPSTMSFQIAEFYDTIDIDLPATLLEKKEITFNEDKFIWNGFLFEALKNSTTKSPRFYSFILNQIYEQIKAIEVISVKRGFFSPIFSSEANTDESRLAMQISNEGRDFDLKIDNYFNKVFDKHFRFVAVPGSSSFYLRTDNKTGKTIDLVNEGFGINQFVYMLIKLLKKETGLAFIEEPEIHLHPSAQGKMVDVFVDIINKEDKQIFLTTHSENIVTAALSKIAAGELSIDDVQFLLAELKDGETIITPQTVNEKGQLEGGLLSFMETELESLKKFLGI